MAAYVIVDIAVLDPEVYETYKRLAPTSIATYGGHYLARGGATQVLEGTWTPNRLVILEFPTAELARAWWASAEYAEAKVLRHASASATMVLVEGA